MRKSKLETYQVILDGLRAKALSLDCLSYETGIECRTLKPKIEFLKENGLIREKVLRNEIRFAISSKGLAVSRALDIQRQFEIVRTAVLAVEYPLQPKTTVAKQHPECQ